MLKQVLKQFFQKNKLFIITLFGTISWSLTMVKSGWFYSSLGINGSGLGFWGANGHDGIWHIALAESLSQGSFSIPIFAGSIIQNYHIGFDLILAILHKITFIPIINLYFQILPVIFSILIGLLTYKFTDLFINSKKSAFWATFFVYFGGSFGWILGKGESAFWAQQAVSSLINPPFALSLIFLLFGLILIFSLEEKFKIWNFVLSILFFGSLIEIKAYAGVLALGGLLVSGLYSFILYKKSLLLKIFMGSLILSLIVYLPFNSHSVSLFVFQPFWFLETLMGLSDRLDWPRFESAMINYKLALNYFKGYLAYLVDFAIFWLGNMGTRILKEFTLLTWLKNIKRLSWTQVFIGSFIVAGGVIPMLFLQKGSPWNTIQFFYYSLFFSSILAGTVVSQIKSKLLISLIVLATIPTTLITLKDVYIPNRPPAMVSESELSALNFLSKQPQGIVLTKPFDSFLAKMAENNPPRPLYLYTSTAYVSAFSKQPTFLEDEINLDITVYDWQDRRSQIASWYQELDTGKSRQFLVKNDIKYIYWIKASKSPLDLGKLSLANIFENDLVIIYRVE